jgi:ABC-type sugar transport system permease subunit
MMLRQASSLSAEIIGYIQDLVNNIFELSWRSGIQILVFLAGLQTIPTQMYEVASIEGATKWESFWKITFPLISPLLLVNVVYTIIDSFTDIGNTTMSYIFDIARNLRIAYGSALAWVYFLLVALVIGIVYRAINRHVFYIVE